MIGAIYPEVKKMGFRWVELSWILENNRPMRSILERLGAKSYKTIAFTERRWDERRRNNRTGRSTSFNPDNYE